MKRRELAGALIATTGVSALPLRTALGSSCATPCYPQTPIESAAGVQPKNSQYPASPVYDMARYGLGSAGADNSRVVQAVFNMLKATGGTMVFPFGDWAFYLDVSGPNNRPVFIEGNGSTFRPYNRKAPNSCVVFADNGDGTGGFRHSNVTFSNCVFNARKYGSTSPGDVNYCVEFHGASAQFWRCKFFYGESAGFYAFFGQYNEFWSCVFAASTASASSAGCILDSRGIGASSNEVLFDRCKFMSNSNGLVLRGAQVTRVRDCTIQDSWPSGIGGIVLAADATGSACGGTIIEGCWFELNATAHIVGLGHQGTIISANTFWPTQHPPGRPRSVLQFGTKRAPRACYDLKIVNNNWLGGGDVSITICHPAANADIATLTWRGNGKGAGGPIVPTVLSLEHAGRTYIDGPTNVTSLSK